MLEERYGSRIMQPYSYQADQDGILRRMSDNLTMQRKFSKTMATQLPRLDGMRQLAERSGIYDEN